MKEPKKVTGYECPLCAELYLREDDAAECCEPDRVEAWDCEGWKCDQRPHRTKEEALTCMGGGGCECGCPKKWHGVAQGFEGCYSPGCSCRAFEPVRVAA